jgi:hypothetical protein
MQQVSSFHSLPSAALTSQILQSGGSDKQQYLTGIGELYAAEVLGEGLANRWMKLTTDPIQKYKLGLFLQLVSEAKVRLRTRTFRS